MIAVEAAAPPVQAVPAAADQTAVSGLVGAEALKPFFQRLRAAGTNSGPPVLVLQLGDSHSAADHISGAVRARMQAQFGEGGRGVLPPGRPFKAYNPRQVTLKQSDGWRLEAGYLIPSLAAASAASADPAEARVGPGPFGLAGFRLTSTHPGASLEIDADPEAHFDRVVVCAEAGPQAGALVLAAGPTSRRLDFAAPEAAPACRSVDLPGPEAKLELTADGGPVSLFSWAALRSGGATVSNLGVIGARIDEFAARDDAVLAAELAAYRPALIMVAFGVNDGFQQTLDPAAYETRFQDQLKRLKRLAPHTALLVLGPPDADTSRPDIPLDGVHNLGFECSPLSPSETAGYTALVTANSPQLARWYPPPMLAQVRDAQRRAAAAEGAAFWDWRARMGGDCSAHRLAHAYPPLMRGDHVHFNSEGGDLIAGLLWGDLIAAYSSTGAR